MECVSACTCGRADVWAGRRAGVCVDLRVLPSIVEPVCVRVIFFFFLLGTVFLFFFFCSSVEFVSGVCLRFLGKCIYIVTH